MQIEKIENELVEFYLVGDPSDVIQGYVKSLKNSEVWEIGVLRQDQVQQIKKAKSEDAFSLINLQPYYSLIINKKDQQLTEFHQLYQMFFDLNPESQMKFKLITAVVFFNYHYKTEIMNINVTEKLSECTFDGDKFKFKIDKQKVEFTSPFTTLNYVATYIPYDEYFDFEINSANENIGCAIVPANGYTILAMDKTKSIKLDQAWDYLLMHQYLTYFCLNNFKDEFHESTYENYSEFCQKELFKKGM